MEQLSGQQSRQTGRQTWSIGVLCYNEAGTIEAVIADIVRTIGALAADFEIIVADDGSTDGSREILQQLAPQIPQLVPVFHERNLGIGEAFVSIYSRARFENILVVPGDGQFDLQEMVPYAQVDAGSFVCFYRKENTIYNPFRNTLSLFNKKINQFFVGITVKDVNWVKIYKQADVARLDLQLRSSLIESEIIAKLLYLGRSVIEVESKYLPRSSGVSKGASWKIVRQALKDTLVLVSIIHKFRKGHPLMKSGAVSRP